MILETMICNFMGTNCYIFGDSKTNEVLFIDPGGEENALKTRIEQRGYKLSGIVLTHGHFDHTGAVKFLKENFNVPVMYNKKDLGLAGIREAKFIKEPDVIKVGSEELHVLDAPGHSPGGILLVSYENKIIFAGDSIFCGSIGRTDLGGNMQELMNTIHNKIMYNEKITDDFQILCGHMDETSVGNERENNMFRDEFL